MEGLCFCVYLLVPLVSSARYYPANFNAALNRPVTLIPSDGTCGLSGGSTYCVSSSNVQSTSACTEETCSTRCPNNVAIDIGLPLDYLEKDNTNCTFTVTGLDIPQRTAGTGEVKRFLGNSTIGTCYLDTKREFSLRFELNSIWSIAITSWVYSEQDTNIGMLVEFSDLDNQTLFGIGFEENSIVIQIGNEVHRNEGWKLNTKAWTHLSVLVYGESTSVSVSVYVHGLFVYPALHQQVFSSHRSVKNMRLGNTKLEDKPFKGYVQDLKFFWNGISNRDIAANSRQQFKDTLVQTECRCPIDYPQLKPSNDQYCIPNDGPNKPQDEKRRISADAHWVELVTDGDLDTKWISDFTEEHNITISLKEAYEVQRVTVKLYSPYPGTLDIERATQDSTFLPWQFYSQTCRNDTGLDPEQTLTSEDDISCKYFYNPSQMASIKYSSAEIVFDLLSGRPGVGQDGQMTPALHAFVTTDQVQVILRGHPLVNDKKHKYHGIYEITVDARCNCHGHGVSCDTTMVPYVCECAPESNTKGRQCTECQDGTFKETGADDYDELLCSPCNCNPSGIVGSDTAACEPLGGQCTCKQHVGGRACDTCSFGFYDLDLDNPLGCSRCQCLTSGTVDGSTSCDLVTGQCLCQPGAGLGLPSLGGIHCRYYVSSIEPSYGPEAGETRLVLQGGYLGNISAVKMSLGEIELPVLYNESTAQRLVCVTKSLGAGREDLLGEQLQLHVNLSDGTQFSPEGITYQYRRDPIITNVTPRKSFIRGGIDLTVTGSHLDSVAAPSMLVHMVFTSSSGTSTTTQYSTPCTHINSTIMTCPTPEIELPQNFENGLASSRKRRNINNSLNIRHRRQVDQVEEDAINSETLQFYLGFHLDGVTRFRNLSESLPEVGIIFMYLNPEFDMFDEPGNVKVFKTYWPHNDEYLEISGDRMTHGATVDDYTVLVGEASCTDIVLYENNLRCTPPSSQPDPRSGFEKDGAPDVQVAVGYLNFHIGYVRYETNIWQDDSFRYGIIGGIVALIVVIITIILLCCWCKRRRNQRKKSQPTSSHKVKGDDAEMFGSWPMTQYKEDASMTKLGAGGTQSGGYLKPAALQENATLLDKLSPQLRSIVRQCHIDKDLITLGRLIGEGQFGRVYLGQMSGEDDLVQQPVAVKTLREYNVSAKVASEFLEEATLMRNFRHDHVLGLLGVAIQDNNAYVVLPYMENGDLKTFISNDDNMLTVGELIHFAMQIADGMHYLSEQHFVHRDLACRNCMINKDFIVRVADFGLSRDIYESDYYKVSNNRSPLPVKWMSLESLESGKFDTKSDVWSFGVVLWELLTRGCQPYPDIDNFDMKAFLMCGNRMDRPDYAPDEMYLLMLDCWLDDPSRRPSFRKIYNRIAVFLDESSTKTIIRDKQSQQVPSIAFRGRSYLKLMPDL